MSLTRTAYVSRQTIKFGGIFVIGFSLLWSLSAAGLKAYREKFPPYQAPTIRYGIIPKVKFPEKTFEKKNFSFEFANDKVPGFSDQAKVFIVYKPNSSFLALDYYSKIANNLGFTADPVEVQTGVFEFSNNNLNQKLTINVLDGSFKMKYPYENDQLLFYPENMPGKEEAIMMADSYLDQANKLSQDLENGQKEVSYWKIDGGVLVEAQAQSDAHFARVDYFREKLDENTTIVTSEPGMAPISILVSGSQVEGKKVVEVRFQYANIERSSWSTYPIKTSEEAIEELKQGNYWPAADVEAGQVTIRRLYLAYYEPFGLTNYMQPVFVFEGDGGFVAYVPAVTESYSKD